MQKEVKPLKLNATIQWAFLTERNEMSGAFQVDLCNLSKAAVDALTDLGVEVRHKDDKGFFVTGKSRNYPIEAQLSDGGRIPEGTKVGNGSKAKAVVSPYEWKFKNKKGVSISIKKLIITDLVPYVAGGDFEDAVDVDGGIEEMVDDVL